MSETREIRLALLISGGGTTMEAILRECRPAGRLHHITPVCVIASTPEAGGIAKACRYLHGENVTVIERREHASPEAFGEAIIAFCRARGVDWIGQYGWMPKTPKNVIDAFEGRMINQHPGPVRPGKPGFGGKGMYGMRVHAARLLFVERTERDEWTEATAQLVHPEFDEGEVIAIGNVPVLRTDSPLTLQQRVLPVEHDTQIRALQLVMERRVEPLRNLRHLVKTVEVELLEQCKREAIAAYPKG